MIVWEDGEEYLAEAVKITPDACVWCYMACTNYDEWCDSAIFHVLNYSYASKHSQPHGLQHAGKKGNAGESTSIIWISCM